MTRKHSPTVFLLLAPLWFAGHLYEKASMVANPSCFSVYIPGPKHGAHGNKATVIGW